ncbi:unannotated protein [freshwater metagenome]|uniref:Unannotated protein n=1 Tax=freshwater metagenome TaxID=449393 RepID=A0A6J6FXJ2_9ZZZZ
MDAAAELHGAVPSLSATDRLVLQVLAESVGRIVGRDTIIRRAGLDHASTRRADASIVAIRKHLGATAITTVRRRGWMLLEESLPTVIALLQSQI